jgi:hypothetical protein
VKPKRLCHAFGRANQHTKNIPPKLCLRAGQVVAPKEGCVNAFGRANQHANKLQPSGGACCFPEDHIQVVSMKEQLGST